MRTQTTMLVLLTTIIFTLAGSGPAEVPAPAWKLVWSDEFDQAGAPDASKWGYEVGFIRNHEAQYYTDNQRENARVENGCLVIEARKERFEGPTGKTAQYTSASLTTNGKADWQYGRVEVRAKIPAGRGTWPAIWMMPATDPMHDWKWPTCGEIDIMEAVGFEHDLIHQTTHSAETDKLHHAHHSSITTVDHLTDDFHVYAMQWDKSSMQMFIDGKACFEFANEGKGTSAWPFDKPFHLKLNLAIGGDWGGQKGIDDTVFPCRFLIDYVRVYRNDVGGQN